MGLTGRLLATRRGALALAAAGVAWPASAIAYLLPNEHLLKRASKRLKRRGDLQVALVGRARVAGEVLPVGERWIFSGRQIQLDVNGPGKRATSWRRDARPEGDVSLLPTDAERSVFGRLFADRDVPLLARDLRIDLDASHLTLVGERVAHVVGVGFQQRRDRTLPALWIDQETFEVLRVRVPGSTVAELRLTEWDGPATRGAFPQKLQVTLGGRWVRRLEVDQATIVGGK